MYNDPQRSLAEDVILYYSMVMVQVEASHEPRLIRAKLWLACRQKMELSELVVPNPSYVPMGLSLTHTRLNPIAATPLSLTPMCMLQAHPGHVNELLLGPDYTSSK